MITEIVKHYGPKDIERELRKLEKLHRDPEHLYQRVSITKCSSPHNLDDYVLWEALSTPDVRVTESVVFYSYDIYGMMTPRRMELLQVLAERSFPSIKDLAQAINRDYKNVYDDLLALKKFELIDLVKEGKNIRPVAQITKILSTIEK